MKLPKDLGDIEFLRNHPAILKMLIERSDAKSLKPFIESKMGGFTWVDSPEGHKYWEKVLLNDPTHFYTLYPQSSGKPKENWTFRVDPDVKAKLLAAKYPASKEVNALLTKIANGL